MGALLKRQLLDGSRAFGEVPLRASLRQVRDHLLRLPGATITGFVRGDHADADACIDFDWEGYAFTIHDRSRGYRFAVADPACPEALLRSILVHFAQL
jgi:hypothetical protein